MMTLQDRLDSFWSQIDDFITMGVDNPDTIKETVTQAIEKDILELLPEKQKASDMWHRNKSKGMKASEAIALTDAYNEALEDVRLKLKKYMKGTE
jgi:hypothetical protein